MRAEARLRSRLRLRSPSCGRRRRPLHTVVVPGVVTRGDDRGGRPGALREKGDGRRGRDASAITFAPSAASPLARSSSIRGPEFPGVTPDEERVGTQNARRGRTERDDQRSREVGVRVAAHTVPVPKAKHAEVGPTADTAAPCGPSLSRTCDAPSRARRVRAVRPSSTPARVGIQRDERAGDSEPDRTRLTAHAAAVERRVDVVDLFGLVSRNGPWR